MNEIKRHNKYAPLMLTVADKNKIFYCRLCKRRVLGTRPDICPHCKRPFETPFDNLVRVGAFLFILVCCMYLWQKVLIGL
ncbi:hypothetical protein JW960_27660 [candidate division KSB1 bacterium]|nr:hypothetical protein [candidate division KSB1 bacterium]